MEGKDLLCPITSVRGFPEGCTCQKDRCAWYEPELEKCSVLVIAKAAAPTIQSEGRASASGALPRTGLDSRPGRCWALPTGEQHPRRQPRQTFPTLAGFAIKGGCFTNRKIFFLYGEPLSDMLY